MTVRLLPDQSATLPLADYGRVARHLGSKWSKHTMCRFHAGLPSMIVIPVGEGVLMGRVSLRLAAL